MHDAVLFAVLALACYRVTRFVVKDTIAEPVFGRLRERLEERWIAKHAGDDENLKYLFEQTVHFNSKLAYMLSCPWCLGFWVSGAGSLLVSEAYGLDYLMFALLWLATSTIVGLIGRIDSD
jgi:Protein of unknown function (DUF1360).